MPVTDPHDAAFDTDTLRRLRTSSRSGRRPVEADAKLWQVPGLSLTAHAFLLATITLGSQSDADRERVVAAVLGCVAELASVPLMRRNSASSQGFAMPQEARA